ASSVFLVGARALKVKRAVRFPFLDYSSLDKRRAACAAELEVNRPFAPELYRRIVAITRAADGRLALDGKGEPVAWAVHMLRFHGGGADASRVRHAGATAGPRPRRAWPGRGGARGTRGARRPGPYALCPRMISWWRSPGLPRPRPRGPAASSRPPHAPTSAAR